MELRRQQQATTAGSRGVATPEQRSGDAFADAGEGAADDAGYGADLGGGGDAVRGTGVDADRGAGVDADRGSGGMRTWAAWVIRTGARIWTERTGARRRRCEPARRG